MTALDVFTAIASGLGRDVSLPAAARQLAAGGIPVFPCAPGGKRPITERGFHDASIERAQVEAWWRHYPQANIGVPTGAVSGFVVVDVDVHAQSSGYTAFGRAARAGLVGGWRMLVDTPSGGMHAYYPADANAQQRCWQAARAGIDFRGDGGYVVVPPSTVSTGGGDASYRVRQVGSAPGAGVDTEALRDFLDPRPASSSRPVPRTATRTDVSRLASWVATRGEGERNRGLFWAACRLAENGVPASDALDVLSAAAGAAGLGEREIATTVRSAYRLARPASGTERERRGGGSWPAMDAGGRATSPSTPARSPGL